MLHPISHYAHEVRPGLPAHSFPGMAFVGHELLHGSMVRSRWLRKALGWLCFAPFTHSATLWIEWHNRVHHGNTLASCDPDRYPTLAEYRESRAARIADLVSPGMGRWTGILSLLFGFTGQSLQILLFRSRRVGPLTRRQHTAIVAETLLAVASWGALAWAVGLSAFLWAYIVPLLIGNAVVMTYIFTNHGLSPLTDINDPLVNSLSVRTWRVFDVLHLQFGLHVEHHLFPSMSGRFAPLVRDELRRRYPERYQEMSLAEALWRLHTSPRIYEDATTLIDPKSGLRVPTLGARIAAESPRTQPYPLDTPAAA